MIPHKLAMLFHSLNDRGYGPIRPEGDELRCRCPAHDDKRPSLYIAVTPDKILLNCKASCRVEDICNALDHEVSDLFLDADEPQVAWECDLGVGVADGTLNSAPAVTAAAAVLAHDELRTSVYTQFLDKLELSMAHFDDLRRRGLSPEEIGNRGYRTADNNKIVNAVDELLSVHGHDALLTIPGFSDRGGRVVFSVARGLLIPVRDTAGRVVAIKVRHDGQNGPKYSWASSRDVSCGNPVHVPLGVAMPSKTVRVTEGELKADVATALSSMATISAPGVGNWRSTLPVLKSLGARKVLLAFDQDGKPATLTETEKALFGFTTEGFEVILERWDGKSAKGIDDLLAVGGTSTLVSGIDAIVCVRSVRETPGLEAKDAEPEPKPFPVDVFPPNLSAYCREVSDATNTPPDFGGQTMLVTAGAAIGNSRALELRPGVWYECPRFYAANVGDPATGKTPAMDAVIRPYQAAQVRAIKEYKDRKSEYENAQTAYDQVVKENRVLPDAQQKTLPAVPSEPRRPERFIAVDATVESLAPILEENPRGLLNPQDEGVAWVRGMGQYKGGRGNDRQFWLSTWSGKSHLVDRKSQGGIPICIPRPFINVICGLPPDMLSELADGQGRNDGFFHRILFAFPKHAVARDWDEVTVSAASKQAWENTVLQLRKLNMEELDDGVLGYKVVKFSPAAKDVWISWWNAHAAEIRSPELPAQLIGPWGKLRSYAARFALVLHYLWLVQTHSDEHEVEPVAVERAIQLVGYYKSQLQLVYNRLRLTPDDNHLFEVIDWIRRHGGECTARQLVRAKRVAGAEKAKKLLKELEEQGYGRLEVRVAANGQKMNWFVFDPAT